MEKAGGKVVRRVLEGGRRRVVESFYHRNMNWEAQQGGAAGHRVSRDNWRQQREHTRQVLARPSIRRRRRRRYCLLSGNGDGSSTQTPRDIYTFLHQEQENIYMHVLMSLCREMMTVLYYELFQNSATPLRSRKENRNEVLCRVHFQLA